jgi:hypothetical protein
MSVFLWVFVSILAYVGGVIIMLRVTPRLLVRSFDEELFMATAALDIVGAILAFGGVVITFAVFSGAIWIKVIDFLLVVGILVVGIRMALLSAHPPIGAKTIRTSRIITAVYCACIALAAIYYLIQMFLVS